MEEKAEQPTVVIGMLRAADGDRMHGGAGNVAICEQC